MIIWVTMIIAQMGMAVVIRAATVTLLTNETARVLLIIQVLMWNCWHVDLSWLTGVGPVKRY